MEVLRTRHWLSGHRHIPLRGECTGALDITAPPQCYLAVNPPWYFVPSALLAPALAGFVTT
jgi:hypothetical protein